jgi:hypothetical protein
MPDPAPATPQKPRAVLCPQRGRELPAKLMRGELFYHKATRSLWIGADDGTPLEVNPGPATLAELRAAKAELAELKKLLSKPPK